MLRRRAHDSGHGRHTGRPIRRRSAASRRDWQLVIGRTLVRLVARYIIEAVDGASVFAQNAAMRIACAEGAHRLAYGRRPSPRHGAFSRQPNFETCDAHWQRRHDRRLIVAGARLKHSQPVSLCTVLSHAKNALMATVASRSDRRVPSERGASVRLSTGQTRDDSVATRLPPKRQLRRDRQRVLTDRHR